MCNIHMTGICTIEDLITDYKNIKHSQQFTGQPINLDLKVYIQEHPNKTETSNCCLDQLRKYVFHMSHIFQKGLSPPLSCPLCSTLQLPLPTVKA